MQSDKWKSLILITRPINAVMAAAAVALGWWIAGCTLPVTHLICLMAAASCALAFGNVLNDIIDYAGDIINHPLRPLPSKQLSIGEAKVLAMGLAAASVVLALFVSIMYLGLTVAALALLAWYNARLKATPFAGNLAVAALASFPLIYGAASSTEGLARTVIPAALAFLLHFTREIVKDQQDRTGDQLTGVYTTASLPAVVLKGSVAAATILYLPMLFAPWVVGHFGKAYLFAVVLAAIPLAATRTVLYFGRNPNYARISTLCKIELLCGLGALAAGLIIV